MKITIICGAALSLWLNSVALGEHNQGLPMTAVHHENDQELRAYRCRFGHPDQCNEKSPFDPTQHQYNNNNNQEKKINGDNNFASENFNKTTAEKSNATRTILDAFHSFKEFNNEKPSHISLSNSVIALTLCTALLILLIIGYIGKKKCNRKSASSSRSIEPGTELRVISVSRETMESGTEEANGYLVPNPIYKQPRKARPSGNKKKKQHTYEEIDPVFNISAR